MKTYQAAMAMALVLACGAALANSHGPGKGEGMDCAGMERGGMQAKMSPEQHKAKMEKHWAELDTDKDGSISRAEFDHHHAAMAAGHDGEHAGPAEAKADEPAQQH